MWIHLPCQKWAWEKTNKKWCFFGSEKWTVVVAASLNKIIKSLHYNLQVQYMWNISTGVLKNYEQDKAINTGYGPWSRGNRSYGIEYN